ncbi:MAG: hypothetical protein OFPI_01410 [Osedax symbiont Rs2]|nr:MAG: hypothetical protein OFPI_01410 [Osedax symbiont Rs2]
MPIKSDTSDKVQRAADELLAKGQRPTQQAVRNLIGSGSITTINHALNLWWAGLSQRLSRQSEHPALPEPVITAASKLWDQALAYSHAALEDQRQALNESAIQQKRIDESQLFATQSTLLAMQQQNNRLLEGTEQLVEQKNALTQRVNELESSLIKERAKKDDLTRTNRQQEILLSQSESKNNINNQSDDLFQARINLKVNEAIIDDLKNQLSTGESKCTNLQQQLYEQEKSYIKQIHRLELVIAQQDTKYDNVKEQLESFQQLGR